MWANDETSVVFPVEQIAEFCLARGALYHCDAVQAGKVPIDVRRIPVDYRSNTGHKSHAPKGIGALYVRRKAPFSPLIDGGHQERNRRGGTENVPLIVGLGKAAELACKHLPDYHKKVRPLLGPDSHSPRGIMRPSWNREDFGVSPQGAFKFTPEQAHQMRAEVSKRYKMQQVGAPSETAAGK